MTSSSASVESVPRLLAELPGTGGVLKSTPEDFVVEELPAYEPSGEGEHLFLWIEKVDRDTQSVARALGRGLGIGEREVAYAGMKDRRAVTRQFFSVPAKLEAKVAELTLDGARVLFAKRHGNKLRTGHLRGNRFQLRVRDVVRTEMVATAMTRLQREGMPNYFGEQRFGTRDDNAELGRMLLQGERLPKRPDRFQRKLYLSAFQSLLFNRGLAARLREGTFARALEGDVLRKHESGGLFVCSDPAADQPRVDAFEVSPAGPLFGPKMIAAEGEVARAETRLLEEAQISLDAFSRGGGETEGGRRHYRVPLEQLAWALTEPTVLELTFVLPKGSYATVLLREVMGDG